MLMKLIKPFAHDSNNKNKKQIISNNKVYSYMYFINYKIQFTKIIKQHISSKHHLSKCFLVPVDKKSVEND